MYDRFAFGQDGHFFCKKEGENLNQNWIVENPGNENRAFLSHPQGTFVYLSPNLRSTLSSKESTVLIVLRQCAMLYLSTADSARLNLKEVNLWSQDICKKRMVSIMWY